jgi:hypothetical protein
MKIEVHAQKVPTLLRLAALLSLVGLALMMWSLVDPRPPPILVGLSLGQIVGTTAFVIYLSVVIWDLRRRRGRDTPPEDRVSLSKLR